MRQQHPRHEPSIGWTILAVLVVVAAAALVVMVLPR